MEEQSMQENNQNMTGKNILEETFGIKTVKEIIEETAEDICENYCRYRNTEDEDGLCDRVRDGSLCPLERLL